MIGLEIVDLLLEEDGPEVLAEEFDHVEIVEKAGPVAGESGKTQLHVSPDIAPVLFVSSREGDGWVI